MSNHEAPLRRENIAQLQIVRALCIIGVITVHSTSAAVLYLKDSHLFFLYNFANTFMRFGTPTFIFLSSFVLFYNYYEHPISKGLILGFYKKRITYILIPYLMFSALYYVIAYHLNHRDLTALEALRQFGHQVLIGKTYTHLYFVFINVQFYLFFPLALVVLKKVPGLLKWCIPLGLGIQYAFVLLNKFYWQVTYPGSWMFSYMSYFLLGAYLGSYFPKLRNWLILSREHATKARVAFWVLLWTAWLAAVYLDVFINYQGRLYGTKYNTTLFEFAWNARTYLGAFILLQIAFLIHRHAGSAIVRRLSQLGSLSFGIYLFHPLLNLIYRSHPVSPSHSKLVHLWYAGGFLFALVGSWLIVGFVVRYIPFSWVMFGKSPLRKINKQVSVTAAR